MKPLRSNLLRDVAEPLVRMLEDREEVNFVVDLVRTRGRELGRHVTVAHETLSRKFLQQRYQLWGMEFSGPWPLELEQPLAVWHKKSGIDLSTSKTYTKKWEIEISRADFVALGARNLGRYVELQLPVAEVIKDPAERAEYGYVDGKKIEVFCTLRSLITARPRWVIDTIQRVRAARARAIAREHAKGAQS